jgi:N-acetylglucosaminyl-diphospho-decaprenol L-rhamnosyltransferase
MKLSIVIVNYNVRYFLELCLLSVQKASENIASEIIVVDNSSTDGSCEMLAQNYPEVHLIQNKENVGFSKANNQGVSLAKGEYVLILNPDTVVSETTFDKILEFADQNKNLGVVGVQLVDGAGMFLPESKRGVPTLKATFCKLTGFNAKKGTYYNHDLDKDQNGQAEILVGAFMLLKKNVYEGIGGFDEDYFMYGEDIDLSYKLLKEGYQNYYFGQTKAIHFKGESTRKDVRYLKHFHGAMEIFYKKHFNTHLTSRLFMKLGSKLWFFMKYIQLTDTPILLKEPKHILYVGERKISLEKQMKKSLEFIRFLSSNQIKAYIEQNDIKEVWFDESSLSFEKIIEMITMLPSEKCIYKIHPKGKNFVIGSNSSDGRGEIIGLTN